MTFAARALNSQGYVPGLVYASLAEYVGSGTVSASLTLGTAGGLSVTGSSSYTDSPNWFTPTTTGIGNSYWVKFQLVSGSSWDAGLADGTLYALSTARTVQWTLSVSGSKYASAIARIYSDALGTNFQGAIFINLSLSV